MDKNFSGDVILPGDPQYEQASTIFAIKGSPALVVRPRTTADVAMAIKHAVDNTLVVSVRSGGHSNAGLSTNDGGIVIDLMHFNKIELIDKDKKIVRLGAGAKWGDAAKQLGEMGLAISSGDTRTVGVGGLTVGAGVGWMVRKYGLTIDSVVAATVVTADGRTLRASQTEHPDLFWAVRGGGGNFGICTEFEITAHPTGKVYAGTIMFSQKNLAKILTGWRDHMRTAPLELTTMFTVLPNMGDMPASVAISCCYAGDDKTVAMQAIDPLLKLDTATYQDIKEKDYADVLEDAHLPPGVKALVNNTFVKELSDALIDTIAKQTNQIFQIRSVGGKMNDVASDATAFAHRDSEVLIVAPVFVAPSASEQEITAALAPWREIKAFGNGAYSSFFSTMGDEQATAAYPQQTYDRLAEIKAAYDPKNIFNQNLNIKPKKV